MKKEKITISRKTEEAIAVYLTQNASQYHCHLNIIENGGHFNMKSVMAMMSITLTPGTKIIVEADGPDEREALEGIRRFLEE